MARRGPDFLGIGFARCGTTWLHEVLASHPDIFVPRERKELDFYSYHFARGVDWYHGFFPTAAAGARYRAVGEVSVSYVRSPATVVQVRDASNVTRVLAMVRDPVARLRSVYAMQVRDRAVTAPFDAWVAANPEIVAVGRYAERLAPWAAHFGDRLLVLVMERAVAAPQAAFARLGAFLDVDPAGFALATAEQRVNASHVPRFRRAYRLAQDVSKVLRKRFGLDRLVNAAIGLGIQRAFLSRGALPPLAPATRARLLTLYEPSIAALEALTGDDLALWRRGRRDHPTSQP